MFDKLVTYVQANQGQPKNWFERWITPIFVVLALIVLMVALAYRSNVKTRRINQLKRDMDLLSEERSRILTEVALADTKQKRAELQSLADQAMETHKQLASSVGVLERAYEDDLKLINNLRSWDDVDNSVR